MEKIVLIFAGLAFLILILGAVLYHPKQGCGNPDCPCCNYDEADFDLDLETPLCEDECNADGKFGECTKCGWIDHLAQAKSDWPKDDDGDTYDPNHICVTDIWGLCAVCDKPMRGI